MAAPRHDDRAGVFLIESADEAPALHRETAGCASVYCGSAPRTMTFSTLRAAVSDLVGITEEEPARAEGGDDLYVRSSLADEVGVVVFEILCECECFQASGRDRIPAGNERRSRCASRAILRLSCTNLFRP